MYRQFLLRILEREGPIFKKSNSKLILDQKLSFTDHKQMYVSFITPQKLQEDNKVFGLHILLLRSGAFVKCVRIFQMYVLFALKSAILQQQKIAHYKIVKTLHRNLQHYEAASIET